MIGFKEFLSESYYQNLFHATSASGANGILFLNNITATTNHMGLGIKEHGVSLTRSYNTALTYGFHEADFRTVIIFELDQNKLRQNYKILPVNFFGVPTGRHDGKNDRAARHILGDSRDANRKHRMNEYEEFVIGRINNINKYIVKVHVCSELTYHTIQTVEHYKSVIDHPKLYDSTVKGAKGRFYNK